MSDLNKTEIEEDVEDINNIIKEYDNELDKNSNELHEKTNQKEKNTKNKNSLKNVEISKIIGNYLLYEQIGKGSFSKVAKAIHLITEQTVAVKILEKDKIEDEIDIERIIREIEILKTIMHPNIAQIYETYSTSHNIYLMMEYIDGGDLFDYITSNIYLSEPIACYIYRQIISVLDYLAKMGITHRDIKPENILLDKSHKNIKIIDFGLSNYCKNKELLHSSCGSPCYASPEMLSGKPYLGVMTDLWSSGIVLYSMLVGSLPFDDQEIQKLYEQIKIGKFYLPSTLSLEAIDLLKKILEVNPKKRITLKEIKDHPWFNKVQNPLNKGIIYNYNNDDDDNKFPCDYDIVSFVIKEYYEDNKNINKKNLIEMIEKHENNQYTATYYLVKKYILKNEDNNFDLSPDKENNNKKDLKLEHNIHNLNNNKKEKYNIDIGEKEEINIKRKDNYSYKEKKRSNTEENIITSINNKNDKNKKNSKTKIKLLSNNNNNNYCKDNIKEENNMKEDIKKEIPKLDLKNVKNINSDLDNNYIIAKNNQYTMRGISPPNILNNIYDLNSKNNNNIINLKTEENEFINHYKNMNLYKDNKHNVKKEKLYLDNTENNPNINVNKIKNKEIIPSLINTDTDEKIILRKNNIQNKSIVVPFKKEFNNAIKIESSIIKKKKANSHRKKYFNMIPKLNNTNTNIKKNMNIYINNKDININLKNNSNFNNSISKYNYSNYKNININKNKNYIFSYLNTVMPKTSEKDNRRNLSSGIKDKIQISKNSKNKILFGTKLGLLSKINLKNNINNNIIMLNINNNYNNRKHLSRNNNKIDDISRTKYSYFTKSSEKYNYTYKITPRTLEQKTNNNNRINNFSICQNYNGITNLKNIDKNKTIKITNDEIKKINKININDINLSNINNMGNNKNFGLNNLINESYLNRANTINNNIILNIQNYYNRKNNKTYEKK